MTYRDTVQQGDRVRLRDGRTGLVYMVERDVGGCRTVVSIRIDGEKPRFFGLIKPKPVRFADAEIWLLTPIPSEEEIRRIMDDPVELGLEP